MMSEEATDMCQSSDKLAKDGREASVTAELLRQVLAPAQPWLEHF
jgi:hypothetical protein